VVVNYSSSKPGADRVVAEITGSGGKAIAVRGDVSKQAHIERLFSEATKAFGRLDILVNNAGVYEFTTARGGDRGSVSQALQRQRPRPAVDDKGGGEAHGARGRSVINIGSGASSMRPPNSTVYTATKAAVDAITGVAGEGARPAEYPRELDQPGDDRDGRRACRWIRRKRLPERWSRRQAPLGRIGRPDDISPTAVYLASSDSKS